MLPWNMPHWALHCIITDCQSCCCCCCFVMPTALTQAIHCAACLHSPCGDLVYVAACGRLVQGVYLLRAQAARHPQELHVGTLDFGAKGRVHDDGVQLQVLLLLQLRDVTEDKVYLQQHNVGVAAQQQVPQGRVQSIAAPRPCLQVCQGYNLKHSSPAALV